MIQGGKIIWRTDRKGINLRNDIPKIIRQANEFGLKGIRTVMVSYIETRAGMVEITAWVKNKTTD